MVIKDLVPALCAVLGNEKIDLHTLLTLSFLSTFILLIFIVIFAFYFFGKKINPIISKKYKVLYKNKKIKITTSQVVNFLSNFTTALTRLSNDKVGALIVIENLDSLQKFIYNGARIKSIFSCELVYTIFLNHSSPLHDGAMIIRDFEIVSLSSYLPVSKRVLNVKYGARHRAGFGITEQTDALAFVVSETTGNITFMQRDTTIVLSSEPSKLSYQLLDIFSKRYYIMKNRDNEKVINLIKKEMHFGSN